MTRKLKCFGTVAMCYRVPDGVPRNESHGQYRFIVWATSKAAAVQALQRCGIRYTTYEANNHMCATGNQTELSTAQGPGWVYVAPLNRYGDYVRMPEAGTRQQVVPVPRKHGMSQAILEVPTVPE